MCGAFLAFWKILADSRLIRRRQKEEVAYVYIAISTMPANWNPKINGTCVRGVQNLLYAFDKVTQCTLKRGYKYNQQKYKPQNKKAEASRTVYDMFINSAPQQAPANRCTSHF